MSLGVAVAVETLGEIIAAYKQRIAELEGIVANQQKQIETLKTPSEEVI